MAQNGNIIDKLRKKEEEMEALVGEARQRAALIRGDALRRAKEIRESAAAGLDGEIKALLAGAEAAINDEVRAIEEAAEAEAGLLGERSRVRMAEAARAVARFVVNGGVGGSDDKGDDKGPDNRA